MFREGEPVFGPTADLDVFQPLGDVMGTIPREQTFQEEGRALELEGAERDEFSQFA